MSSNLPIGVIDSGVGGLSVLKEICKLLPREDIIYVGDSAWCPYGEKSADEIRRRVFAISDALLARGVKMLVLACNSATIAAVEALRAVYPLPVIGMEPAVKPAVAASKNGQIAVLATSASIAGEKFHRLLHMHANKVRIITRPCPEFVQLVENGDICSPHALQVVAAVIDPLLAQGVDTLVLGCTHYPFLRAMIERVAGEGINVIDSGAAVARQVGRCLEKDFLLNAANKPAARVEIYTSGDLARWNAILPYLFTQAHEELQPWPA